MTRRRKPRKPPIQASEDLHDNKISLTTYIWERGGLDDILLMLRTMIPYLNDEEDVSDLEIVHNAIDYIKDLKRVLEDHKRVCPGNHQRANPRQPLGAIPATSNSLENSVVHVRAENKERNAS